MIVLGIESSCDETGVALFHAERGIIAEALFSQIDFHAMYGGVVPEIASRDHVRRVIPLVSRVMADAGINSNDIDAVAYTAGPGLMGALFVGACTARSLAYAWQKPAIPVHHMEGHLLAPLLEDPSPKFPFVALLVSGGHTQLVDVKAIGEYKILGVSLDDAAGEAFDKVAKMLGLGYPGGPSVAESAMLGKPKFAFPRPMTDRPGLDFSFSGLKTAVLNKIQIFKQANSSLSAQQTADIAAAFQQAVVDTLILKCGRALKLTEYKTLILSGGVSANQMLRVGMDQCFSKQGITLFYPRTKWCTDNGAMIAFAGYQHFCRQLAGRIKINSAIQDLSVKVFPRWEM